MARCWYCGCNATVTRKVEVKEAYLDRLEREIVRVTGELGGRRRVRELHWGGGTPNFLEDDQIERLVTILRDRLDLAPDAELSIECDPRVATPDQLALLRRLGFTRLSFGVQDLDPTVQAAIGRVQGDAEFQALVQAARELRFTSLNFDLVYGLPGQKPETFARTLERVLEMGPDRVACFGYAHVPNLRPNQKRIDATLLPGSHGRFELFRLAVEAFTGAGYAWLGLDHFARPEDELAVAQGEGRLSRNFMGYTTQSAANLLGFGASAIGEVAGRYVQLDAKLGGWQSGIDAGVLPVVRGHRLTAEDRERRSAINQLMCNLELPLDTVRALAEGAAVVDRFHAFEADGLVRVGGDRITVTPTGQFFLRNLCLTLDAYAAKPDANPQFSRTV